MIGAKRYIVLALIVGLVFIPFGSSAIAKVSVAPTGGSDPGGMIVDCLVARPVGFASLVVGTASFLVSLPFSALGRNTEQAFQSMVMDPGRYTFLRPLGNFCMD